MGILSWLGFDRLPSSPPSVNTTRAVASPWADSSHLAPIIAEDIFGLTVAPVTRKEAMTVPAVVRARDLLCETPATQPIKAYNNGTPVANQPTWLYRTDNGQSPRLRTVWTLDDLLFYGWSLWAVQRGADGFPTDAQRIPWERWQFNGHGQVEVMNTEGKYVLPDPNTVVLIPGSREGLIDLAADSIRAYRNTENSWQTRVSAPMPTTELRYTGDADLTVEEMQDVRQTYINARKDVNGAVVVMPRDWELHSHSADALDFYESGRNAATVDIARFTRVSATMLDATNTNASAVTYQNNMASRHSFLDSSLRPFVLALEERLSADDMVPRGTSVQFDFTDLTELPDDGLGPALED